MLRSTGFVDDVNGAVGQFAVIDIARCQLDRGFDSISSVFETMMLFEIRLDPLEDFNRIFDRSSATSIFWNRRLRARSFSKC